MNRMNAKKLIAAVLAAGLGVLAACQSSPTEKTDQNGPYINMTQYEFTTTVGTPINFTNISGYDDYDGLLNTHLEGYVDYNTAGDYYPSITCTDFSGTMTECDEGCLEWVDKAAVQALPIWQGDKIFFRLLAENAPFFHLELTYAGDVLQRAVLDGRELPL
mgnify:CR=1 FL=1